MWTTAGPRCVQGIEERSQKKSRKCGFVLLARPIRRAGWANFGFCCRSTGHSCARHPGGGKKARCFSPGNRNCCEVGACQGADLSRPSPMPLALTGSYGAWNKFRISEVLPCPGRALKPEREVTDALKAVGHVIVVRRLQGVPMLALCIPEHCNRLRRLSGETSSRQNPNAVLIDCSCRAAIPFSWARWRPRIGNYACWRSCASGWSVPGMCGRLNGKRCLTPDLMSCFPNQEQTD